MYPLFETIKVFDGKAYNLEWHQWRLENSYNSYYGKNIKCKLADIISIPEEEKTGFIRLRFNYNQTDYKLDFEPYESRKISSLKLILDDAIDYSLKYSDRTCIEKLLAQKKNCDDILIIKNHLITDTSFSNIVFFDGKRWKTPKSPLLKGTCRERLIYESAIYEEDIEVNELFKFKSYKLINALLDIHDSESLDISTII